MSFGCCLSWVEDTSCWSQIRQSDQRLTPCCVENHLPRLPLEHLTPCTEKLGAATKKNFLSPEYKRLCCFFWIKETIFPSGIPAFLFLLVQNLGCFSANQQGNQWVGVFVGEQEGFRKLFFAQRHQEKRTGIECFVQKTFSTHQIRVSQKEGFVSNSCGTPGKKH